MHPLAEQILVIGHRGASALRPEHTLASYGKAIGDGADFIEPDLVMTRDGVPIARHENEISATTDVAHHAEFEVRRTSRTIDGKIVEGWFTEDFSLAELKILHARERLPDLRPGNVRYDGQFDIPTFDEIIDFVATQSHRHGRMIGIYPEIKHSTHFRQLGLPMEDVVLAAIRKHAYARDAPFFLQSFEVANLKYLRTQLGGDLANVRLIQLLGEGVEQPYAATRNSLTYAQMMRPAGLCAIAGYADAIGPNKLAVIPRLSSGRLGTPTALIADAHAAGLLVHPYTFRPEIFFLPVGRHSALEPAARDETAAIAEIRTYLDAGIDGFFSDDPGVARRAVDR